MVALSESVMKHRRMRPLTKKSLLPHTRHAIKSRYLGWHASQIKSYYRTVLGSHERHQEVMVPLSESVMQKLPEAPSSR